jgi:hypothetical protein
MQSGCLASSGERFVRIVSRSWDEKSYVLSFVQELVRDRSIHNHLVDRDKQRIKKVGTESVYA